MKSIFNKLFGQKTESRSSEELLPIKFKSWAENFFIKEKVDVWILSKEVFESFFSYAPDMRKYYNYRIFKARLNMYSSWKGFTIDFKRGKNQEGEFVRLMK